MTRSKKNMQTFLDDDSVDSDSKKWPILASSNANITQEPVRYQVMLSTKTSMT